MIQTFSSAQTHLLSWEQSATLKMANKMAGKLTG